MYREPQNVQGRWMFNFFKLFCEKMNIDEKIRKLPLRHSQDKQYDGNYIRKENHDIDFKKQSYKFPLFIDIIDDKENIIDYVENYYHIPFGVITYFTRENVDIFVLLKPLKEICNTKKTKFCSYCFKNVTWRNAIKRHKFFQMLTEEKKVDRLEDNFRFDISLFDKTTKMYEPYRFNIAFENDITPGYINEKIFNAFLSGCIPIFDGTRDIFKYFNKKAFIYAGDFENLKELCEYVLKVENDKELYESYINEAPCNEEGLRKMFWWYFN